MVFTTEDKELIKNLYLLKGYGAHRLLAEFPTKNWTLGGLDYLLKKLRRTETTDRIRTVDDRRAQEQKRMSVLWRSYSKPGGQATDA